MAKCYLGLLAIQLAVVLRVASTPDDTDNNLHALLGEIVEKVEHARGKEREKTDEVFTREVALDLKDVGKDSVGITRTIQGSMFRQDKNFNLSVTRNEQPDADQMRCQLCVPNTTSHQLMYKVSEKLRLLAAKKVNSKLDLKITSRILKKIGTIKYTELDNVDHVTAETLDIGAAILSGLSLISKVIATPPNAFSIAIAVAKFLLHVLKISLVGAAGYEKMGTIENYIAINEKLVDKLNETFREIGAMYPSEIGPLDKLSNDYLNTVLEEQLYLMMTPENNETLFEAMWTKLHMWINNGQIKDSDIEDESKMEIFLNEVDVDHVLQKFITFICTQFGGKVIDRGNSDFRCSYKDKLTCESSYMWPLQQGDIYAEYKSSRLNGTCIHAQYILKTICAANHLSYNTETGLCIIDENYCKMKGADWGYNDRIHENDCILNKGQDVAEFIFGETIVRGLKQLFDPRQYKPCHPDEFDDGYFCTRVKCIENEEQYGGFCYPKCKDGFHSFGCCICSPNCPLNWTDDGATCRQAGQCAPGKSHDGALCYDNCKDGFYGVGPICWQNCPKEYHDEGLFCLRSWSVYAKKSRLADKRPCPDGMRDDGLNCWVDTYPRGVGRIPNKAQCPDGLRDDGISCWSDADIYWKGCCCTIFGCCHNCKSGYNDDGCTCRKTDFGIKITLFQRQSCNENEEKYGALCYPKCKQGYHPVGCCLCEPDGGPGIKLTLFQRQYCNENETNFAGICWEKCKTGFTDDGAFCRDSFTKQSYGRGAGYPDTKIQVKPNTSYGRGVGKSAVHIRAKERAVPFSTNNN